MNRTPTKPKRFCGIKERQSTKRSRIFCKKIRQVKRLAATWSCWCDLNARPAHYEWAALPTEPQQHFKFIITNNNISYFWDIVKQNFADFHFILPANGYISNNLKNSVVQRINYNRIKSSVSDSDYLMFITKSGICISIAQKDICSIGKENFESFLKEKMPQVNFKLK